MSEQDPPPRWGIHAFYVTIIVLVAVVAWNLAPDEVPGATPSTTADAPVANGEVPVATPPAVAEASPNSRPTVAELSTPEPTPTVTSLADGRGPTGQNWPLHTPAYTTPATVFVNNLDELNVALGAARSGDVIEVAPHTHGSEETREFVIDNGSAGWEENVLVRPPLGQRQSVVLRSSVTLNAPHVTIAGFRADGTITLFDRADRSAWARIELGANGFVRVRNSAPGEFLDDAGVYEIVALAPRLGDDRMQLSSINGGGVRRFTISGVWLKGGYRPVGTAQHNDTLQVFAVDGGLGPEDLVVENSVFFASHSASIALPLLRNTFTFHNSMSVNCGYMTDVPASHECAGTLNMDIGNSPGVQIQISDSDLFGGLNLRQDDFTTTLHNVRSTAVVGEGAAVVIDAGGNRIDDAVANLYVEPHAPDLDAVWGD